MAKPKENVQKAKQPLDARLVDWLENQGYRLEYHAQRAFRLAGLQARLGAYATTAEGKAREVDVSILDERKPVIVRVLCECKYSVQKPWVLLWSGLKAEAWIDWLSTPRSKDLRLDHLHQFTHELAGCWHFNEQNMLGHGLVQAFRDDKDNRDQAYEALHKIANAAWDMALTPERRGSPMIYSVVVIPCLIVEAPLYLAWCDRDTGEMRAKPIEMGRISWGGCHDGTMVDVVHLSALPKYAEVVKQSFETLHKVVAKMRMKVMADMVPSVVR